MKIAVLGGAGKVVEGAILDLVEDPSVTSILLGDINLEALKARQKFLNSSKVVVEEIDLNNHEALVNVLAGYDVCLNGSSHHFNMKVMAACLNAKTNYTDFGGLFHWAKEQLTMHEAFKNAGITGIVGSGSAPGIVNVMAKYAVENLDTVDSIHIRDGIVNFNLQENDFIPPYTLETLLDEYIMNPYEFKDGEFIAVEPFSGAEVIRFPEPVGEQTVLNTIHSEVATMPISFKDKGIRNVTFKLALPRQFEDRLKFLVELGLGSTDPIQVKDQQVIPRQLLSSVVQLKNSRIKNEEIKHDDHKALRVEVSGTKEGKETKYVLDTVISPYKQWSHISQGVFSVGFPAAVTTRLLGSQIHEKGFFASEQVIPTKIYFEELAKRGIKVEVQMIQNVVDEAEGILV